MNHDDAKGVPFFDEKQKRMIARMCALGAAVVALAIIYLIVRSLFRFVGTYSGVLLPPVVGMILSMILKPLYIKILKLWRGRRIPALSTLIVVLFLPLIGLALLLGPIAIRQAIRFLDQLPTICQGCQSYVMRVLPEFQGFLDSHGFSSLLTDLDLSTWITPILARLRDAALSLGSMAIASTGKALNWLALPIYTLMFLVNRPLSGSDIKRFLPFASEKTKSNIEFLTDQFLEIVVSFFRGQLIVVMIQGVLYGLGFQCIGLGYGFVLGLLLGFLNMIPYLGCAVGLLVILPLSFFGSGGSISRLVWALLVIVSVQNLDAYFITPKIMGKRTGLSQLTIIFSLFFWNAVFGGIIGMLLAIPMSAFVAVLWRLIEREYFPPSPPAPIDDSTS